MAKTAPVDGDGVFHAALDIRRGTTVITVIANGGAAARRAWSAMLSLIVRFPIPKNWSNSSRRLQKALRPRIRRLSKRTHPPGFLGDVSFCATRAATGRHESRMSLSTGGERFPGFHREGRQRRYPGTYATPQPFEHNPLLGSSRKHSGRGRVICGRAWKKDH